ncbi:hypothetical protein IVA87_29140 [Bradyrhizobium sp. 147]|jgi:hypothetical protein|uniref:hypothetical protein n=1 Tax=Bradyrhizobium sp. 179 TaxID=2782648 RepID=UPI001FFA229C|nr:hypothetical protein [Bradyrhizobium sp. 179]MCK1683357.1 hypothetical protein [Bradyrhizobium sp. 147]
MIGATWNRKGRTLVIANCVAATAVLLVVAAAPRPVSSAALGSEWQCSKSAFVLTTCRPASEDDVTRKPPAEPPTLNEQTGAGLGELHVGVTLVQLEPAPLDRELEAGTILRCHRLIAE